MIVDDDYLVRLDLRSQIDWSEHGYELTPDAINGKDALDKIALYNPDILILDMEMPKMSGIEVLQQLKENKAGIKAIVLSCHDDYSNVKEAMRLGAVDYILKHNYQTEELIQVLRSTSQKMAEDRDASEKLKDIRILAKRKQLWDVFNGTKNPSIEFMANLFDVDPEEVALSKYMVTVFSVDKVHLLSESEVKAVEAAIVSYYTNEQGCIFIAAQKNKYVLLHKYEQIYSAMVIYDKMMKEVNALTAGLQSLSELTLTYGMSSLFESEKELYHKYQHALEVLSYRYFLGYNQIISPMDIEAFTKASSLTVNQLQQQLKVFIFETADLDKAVNEFYKNLLDEKMTLHEMMNIRTIINDEMYKIMEQYGADQSHVTEQYELLKVSETVNEDMGALSQLIVDLRQCVFENKTSTTDYMIEELLADIETNYKHPISLKTYADKYYVSTGHLSYLFKKSTGKTFVDYLNAYRVECAKVLLLKKDIKVYEVADAIGFSNYRYFTKIFKAYVHVTPKSYIALNTTKGQLEGGDHYER